MLRGFLGCLIFAIIVRILGGNHLDIHSTFNHNVNGNILINCCVVRDLQMIDCDFQIKSAHDAFFHSFQDKLSPFLRFGCLSPRTVYHALSKVYQKVGVLVL